MFECQEFEDACKELDNPVIDEYEFFVEAMNVKIYRKYKESSGLYEYKTFGVLEGISPDICAKVYTDLEYRKEWDKYAKELYEFKEGEVTGIYWNVNFPFPMYNRDYVFVRETKEFDLDGRHIWVVLGKSAPFESVRERSRTIRVDDFQQSMCMTSDGGSGTKALMHYYDNPKGMLPTWLINWAAKTGVPNFISDMKKHCEKYPEYLEKKSKKEKKSTGTA
ncbi:phosphatidylcholine transfer protein-like [Anneissia japonica]|uniref:phosphatidylcholine transfer protein-like n=1 Tax=Anneissia japonica TaxID=1529436 RepID=UPI0014259346|nr:phosphatidylcholine transfer protein-like [Anneissia japonica]